MATTSDQASSSPLATSPSSRKGKEKATLDNERPEARAGLLTPQAITDHDRNSSRASWTSSNATAISSTQTPVPSSSPNVSRIGEPSSVSDKAPEHIAASASVRPEPKSESEPVAVHRTWGCTPTLVSTLTSGDKQSRWHHHVHLNGSFYNVLVDMNMNPRVVTPDDVKDPQILKKMHDAFEQMKTRLDKARIVVPGPYLGGLETLVIRDLDNPNGPNSFYLCYDRCLYIELFPKSHPDKEILIEYKTEKFWTEVEAYPMHLSQLPRDADVDFLGALSFGSSERIAEWNDTPFPFTDYQSQRLVKVYRSLKKELDRGNRQVVPALTWHIARTMAKIENVRGQIKFGTPKFELYRPVVPKQPSLAVKTMEMCLMILLFGAHRMYRVRLQNARVQGTIYLADFRELLGNFLAEWSDSNLLATVFVGANIAFLAVPNITNLQQDASLASIVFSLVSVLTGVHHVWQHRTKVNASYEDANAYMSHIQPLDDGRDADLAITACFLSIPLVSLLYAVLSFGVAISAFCIQNNDIHGKILLAVMLGVVGTAGVVTLVFFWHVWRGPREVEVSEELVEDVLGYGWGTRLSRIGRRLRGTVKKPLLGPDDAKTSCDELEKV